MLKSEAYKTEEAEPIRKVFNPFIDLMIESAIENITTNEDGRIDRESVVEFLRNIKKM